MYQGGAQEVACLNPCSCGGWSQRFRIDMKNNVKIVVLILVLVEDGLRDGTQKYFGVSDDQVLILVLVEDGLREIRRFTSLAIIN